MLNVEKFKDEIIKNDLGNFAVTKKNRVVNCWVTGCTDCLFWLNDKCEGDKGKIEWLLEEYKEPILTDEEKEYLKAITRIYKNKVDYMERRPIYSREYTCDCICIWIENLKNKDYSSEAISFLTSDELPFKGMEKDKRYSAEDLGL